jgi:nucleoside 2-deoxyribosyltransferase
VIIIGGAYWERCERPDLTRLRGSGLRAAIALRQIVPDLEFHTCISARERPDLQAVVDVFGGFKTDVCDRDVPVVFDYFTPLSPPAVSARGAVAIGPRTMKGGTILRYGMLENRDELNVDADTLVVDPQGELSAVTSWGKFRRLAVVANEREAAQVGGGTSVEDAARQLLNATRADVVVVKCGARGALVVSAADIQSVSVWPADYVFPIGSGDVFAAAFAYAYGEQQLDAVSAARYASRSTAHWCASRAEPALLPTYLGSEELPFGERPLVYIAGPFFGLAQVWLVDLVRHALGELGARPFSPLHDVGRGGSEVAKADLEALDRSDSVLALLDDLDPGTVFEVGYAMRRGTPVVAYLDPRPGQHMVMIEGSGVEVVDDLSSAVYRSIWRGMATE